MQDGKGFGGEEEVDEGERGERDRAKERGKEKNTR